MGLTNQSVGRAAAESSLIIKKQQDSDIVVALAGNPNVGKSTVFNGLTGLKQHTGNWPGKTVTNAVGYAKTGDQGVVLVDLPGCYSLTARSREEEVARDFIQEGHANAVIVVCDATALERNLILALQILRFTSRMVLCVNLLDEASKKQIKIDLVKLEKILGIPVIGTEARNKKGLTSLLEAAVQVTEKRPESVYTVGAKGESEDSLQKTVQMAEEISQMVLLNESESAMNRDRKIDRILTGKLWAFPTMFLLLLGIFWLTIEGANYPSAWLSTLLFSLEEPLRGLFSWAPWWVCGVLVDGAYRVTAWVVSVMLPPMAIFFPLFTLLEDLGYLPRVAFNLDRCFQKCHACGKQALTMR